MKNILTLILFFSIFTTCTESPETKFERDGISLISPRGWQITDEENLENQGYYLSIEKDDLNSSGLITISWINDQIDLIDWINIYKDELRNNIIYDNSNLTFRNQTKSRFNDINTASVNYTASILKLKHEGTIHFFHKKDKTFAILKQEATEDKKRNKPGFELIEQSFKIE